jgi:hypothetical protein
MTTDNISFPHPVLGLSDDIEGSFSLDINVERNKENKTIEFIVSNVIVDNYYFSSLIENKIANIILKIYCSSTFKTWSFKNIHEKIEIPEDDLCNKVDVEVLIVAFQDINNYQDESFNQEFGSHLFTINKYEVIGILGKNTIPIDKNYEKLGIGNIFDFSPEDDASKPCSFEFRTDKIIVKYPVTINGDDPPNGLFHKSPWSAYNMLIVPALTEAFRNMADTNKRADFEDKDWYFVLSTLLPEDERDDEPYANAQLILNKQIPLLKAYEELCIN